MEEEARESSIALADVAPDVEETVGTSERPSPAEETRTTGIVDKIPLPEDRALVATLLAIEDTMSARVEVGELVEERAAVVVASVTESFTVGNGCTIEELATGMLAEDPDSSVALLVVEGTMSARVEVGNRVEEGAAVVVRLVA